MYIGSRRELLWTLRARAERAEAEQEVRVAQARSNERARIAREMHDVLAHRISQISMHAGALAFREDLTADEMRGRRPADPGPLPTRPSTDLRDVLGVLRDDRDRRGARPPAADVRRPPGLVAEARDAGLTVDFEDRVAAGEPCRRCSAARSTGSSRRG